MQSRTSRQFFLDFLDKGFLGGLDSQKDQDTPAPHQQKHGPLNPLRKR